jgi:hypothetical protein
MQISVTNFMQSAKPSQPRSLRPIEEEGKVRSLYPQNEMVMPIGQLVLPKDFTCKLVDILEIGRLVKNAGYSRPILISETNLIIDGKKRYYAFLRLGCETVLVVRLQNSTVELGDNDFSILNYTT